MTKTVLILGARGRFGLSAAQAFADAGWRVLAHMRRGAAVPGDAAADTRIEWRAIDLQDTQTLAAWALGATVVVHALNPAYTNQAWRTEVPAMADACLRIARTLGARVMVPGNVYNFGQGMPALLDEQTPQHASTVKGRIRVAMEQQFRDSGVPTVVIRAGDFFGGGRGTWFDQVVVKDIQKGRFTYPGGKDTPTAWAYLPDLARSFVQVAERAEALASFEVLHFAGHAVRGAEWMDVLTPVAQAQGWVRPGASLQWSRLPWGLMRWLAWLVPTWGALLEMRYLWDSPHALDPRKLVALIGTEPHTPLPQAAHQTLADLGLLLRAPATTQNAPAPAVTNAVQGA